MSPAAFADNGCQWVSGQNGIETKREEVFTQQLQQAPNLTEDEPEPPGSPTVATHLKHFV